MQELEKNSGVTLIALVITIIVLLILSGVAIAILSDNNGILTQATKSKEKTEQARLDELRKLTALEASTNLENTIYMDSNNKTATIPAGFAVSQVEGENTIDGGLVIIDSMGNEFVWVPVNYSEFVRRAGYDNGVLQAMNNYGEVDEKGVNLYLKANNLSENSEIEKESILMYQSIEFYGGFYIGRYETGTTETDINKTGIRGNTVVRRNVNVYNNISWSNDRDTSNITGGAVQVSREFAQDNNYTSVKSTLCYGVQWDATLKFIDPTYSDYVKNSEGKGNYTGMVLNTGNNENYKVKNIYDMAGNVYEWTMESFLIDRRVPRGGGCDFNGERIPASRRSSNYQDVIDQAIGFRITLYII